MTKHAVIVSSLAVTPDQHGGYIIIVAALLMVWSLLFYSIRMAVRLGYNSSLGWDDLAASIATFIGLAQSIVIMLAVDTAGLGMHTGKIDADVLKRTELLVYSGDILFLATIATAKIASFELIARLTQQIRYLYACRVLALITALWGITSILTIGVGCHASRPWDMEDRCADLNPSWFAIGAIDALVEIALVVLPVCLVWPLQMPKTVKMIVLFAFGCRLPLLAIIVLRMLYLSWIQSSTDYTFDISLAMIFLELEMHFSLISMTVACLRPFLRAFNTGSMSTYAAQIEKGMGASPDGNTTVAQSAILFPTAQSSPRASWLLHSPRHSLASTLEKDCTEKRPSFQHFVPLDAPEEHPKLDPASLPAFTCSAPWEAVEDYSTPSDDDFWPLRGS